MTAVGDISGPTISDRRAVISLLRHLRSPEGQADPLPVWEGLRSLGDVVRAPWGAYFVTSFEACSQVLRSRNWLVPDFAWQERQPDPRRWQELATQELTGTLSRINAPSHTCQRRALGNPFDRTTLEGLRPAVARIVTGLLDGLEERLRADGEADFVQTVAELLPVRTVGEWLGIPEEHHAHILDFAHRQAYAQELFPTKEQLAQAGQATLEMRAFFGELIRERRARPGNDVLTGWIRHWDAHFADDPEAAARVIYHLTMFITIASLETSAVLLTNAVRFATEEPARAEWLRAHPEHIDDLIDLAARCGRPRDGLEPGVDRHRRRPGRLRLSDGARRPRGDGLDPQPRRPARRARPGSGRLSAASRLRGVRGARPGHGGARRGHAQRDRCAPPVRAARAHAALRGGHLGDDGAVTARR
ncbi:Putative cytochrome P450 140 [Streptomyces griseoloalbus]